MSKSKVMTMGSAFALAATSMMVSLPRVMAYYAPYRWAYPDSLRTRSNLGINSAYYYWGWGTLLEGFWLETDWDIHEHSVNCSGCLGYRVWGQSTVWADTGHMCHDTYYNFFVPLSQAELLTDADETFAYYSYFHQFDYYSNYFLAFTNGVSGANIPNIWKNDFPSWWNQQLRHEMGHGLGIILNVYRRDVEDCQVGSPDGQGCVDVILGYNSIPEHADNGSDNIMRQGAPKFASVRGTFDDDTLAWLYPYPTQSCS